MRDRYRTEIGGTETGESVGTQTQGEGERRVAHGSV